MDQTVFVMRAGVLKVSNFKVYMFFQEKSQIEISVNISSYLRAIVIDPFIKKHRSEATNLSLAECIPSLAHKFLLRRRAIKMEY